MKVTVHIVLGLVLLLATPVWVQAQAMAVMKVSVTVVNGAGVDNVSDMDLNLGSTETNLKNASFTVTNAPNAEVLITYHRKVDLRNQFGEHVMIDTDANIESDSLQGKHKVSFQSITAQQKNLKGSFQGFLSTTIEYL